MSNIDFINKISINRLFSRKFERDRDRDIYLYKVASQLESDRGRIINSAAVRRLQQKTQVFPLEKNSAVRSRLTHSLEVQQTGRYIVKTIFDELSKQQLLDKYGLYGLEQHIETIVEMACLMHDIGNPPFGHFGEYAINQWFEKNIDAIFSTIDGYKIVELADQLMFELKQFEGNAQAIRLVSNVISLNLTYVQLASLMKYIKPVYSQESFDDHPLSYLYKKGGYYWSEKELVDNLKEELILENRRHPFAYIMEAADDISYCLADIEDAVEKGILDIVMLKELFIKYVDSDEKIEVLQGYQTTNKTIEEVLDYITKNPYSHMDEVGSFFVQFRATLIQVLVKYAAKQFVNNIDQIYNGTLNKALMEMEGIESLLTQVLKKIAIKYVFCHHEVRTLELKGYQIITGLLECYLPVLKASYVDFFNIVEKIVKDDDIKIKTKDKLLVHLVYRLAKKHIKSYYKAVISLDNDEELKIKELYFRCRLIQDYVSGMTDQFAFDEYQELKVAGLN
ncbi:dGTPase [Entomomonas sp. E2T0]|uniref:dGTPase n=1 Tax=Entomomonas sp. E2T0 TaxID=2930213 RepID=UPI0022281B96|nr:dGTPase [Entomomonas sp. E2T0]UYZ84494.1 dGTPase [Entomomonas sp. E2T0]